MEVAVEKKKLNVRLAAQVMSESVATSLQFCLNEGVGGFTGCEATIDFIRLFDHLFDVLNSRNLKSFNWKSPMQPGNCVQVFEFLSNARSYILSLKESNTGRNIIYTNRKTGFIGFQPV